MLFPFINCSYEPYSNQVIFVTTFNNGEFEPVPIIGSICIKLRQANTGKIRWRLRRGHVILAIMSLNLAALMAAFFWANLRRPKPGTCSSSAQCSGREVSPTVADERIEGSMVVFLTHRKEVFLSISIDFRLSKHRYD